MRFLRLRVANYRGIESCEVKFGSLGITLVQGPNEIGKTSLGESIGLLFEYPDSSKHRHVDAIRPVHRDEGPEIELEAESGPYAFTYFKRFCKKPETRLTVTRPNHESHTGREAHERAEAILRETLDIDLWKALTIQQGDAIHQPDLGRQKSLSAALDQAAGGRPADPREEGLFGRVREEYSRYFTERGTERKELQEARRLQAETRAEVEKIAQQLRELEYDIDRAAALQRELSLLKDQEAGLEATLAEQTAALDEITALENSLEAARLKLDSAQKSQQVAQRDSDARQAMIEAVAGAHKAHGELQESSLMAHPALSQAEEEFKKTQAAFTELDKARKEADTIATLQRADFDFHNNKLFLVQIEERKARIDQAREDALQAEEILAQNQVDPPVLKGIQGAERRLLAANARLEAGSPGVHLRALTPCHLQIDNTVIGLEKDEVRALSVADRTRLTVPEVLDIEITAGTSAEGLWGEVAKALDALESACKAAGVENPDEARRSFEERREALRQVEVKGQVEKENLRDLNYEQLERKLHSLQQSVSIYQTRRVQQPTLCPDLDSAKKRRAEAEGALEKANEAWEAARESVEAARNVRDELSSKHQEVRVQLDMLCKDLHHARENLDRARKGLPDEMLDTSLAEAAKSVSSEESDVRSAETSLKVKSPERVRTLAETAKGSLLTAQKRRTDVQTELTEVQTRLKIHGEEGLHEKLRTAQGRFEHLERDSYALLRRAAAARLLFETMSGERDKARKAYVAPLKQKIEHLGRLVFDDSFQVDMNEELQIASRTAKGVTVPFDSLSGGTREQLSLIFRLACSMIVSKDGGTPLILDDALGYTDPERLLLMGAVLSRAAKECQIIIFTCLPDRYSQVGKAEVVSLK